MMDYDSLVLWGAGLTAILYALYRYLGKTVARTETDNELRDILTKPEYQAKGRFD